MLIMVAQLLGFYFQGMDKIMDTAVKDTHFFINKELGHHLPAIQIVSILQ